MVYRSQVGGVDVFFFFNDTATAEIYTLSYTTLFRSLGERARALQQPDEVVGVDGDAAHLAEDPVVGKRHLRRRDRKSTRLNSSHSPIPYAALCLKKKYNDAGPHHNSRHSQSSKDPRQ